MNRLTTSFIHFPSSYRIVTARSVINLTFLASLRNLGSIMKSYEIHAFHAVLRRYALVIIVPTVARLHFCSYYACQPCPGCLASLLFWVGVAHSRFFFMLSPTPSKCLSHPYNSCHIATMTHNLDYSSICRYFPASSLALRMCRSTPSPFGIP